jgi:methylmalonyl-CoA mutase C-terminal domain/subunit
VGMSILSGAHMALFPRVMELLQQSGMDDVLVIAGGIIPDEDVPALQALGVGGIFGPGTPTNTIVDYIRENVS